MVRTMDIWHLANIFCDSSVTHISKQIMPQLIRIYFSSVYVTKSITAMSHSVRLAFPSDIVGIQVIMLSFYQKYPFNAVLLSSLNSATNNIDICGWVCVFLSCNAQFAENYYAGFLLQLNRNFVSGFEDDSSSEARVRDQRRSISSKLDVSEEKDGISWFSRWVLAIINPVNATQCLIRWHLQFICRLCNWHFSVSCGNFNVLFVSIQTIQLDRNTNFKHQ